MVYAVFFFDVSRLLYQSECLYLLAQLTPCQLVCLRGRTKRSHLGSKSVGSR